MPGDLPLLPCVEPNTAPAARTLAAVSDFAYLGTPLPPEAFPSYLASYDFGSTLPDQVVIHNTANPDASWAALGTSDRSHWDRDEAGLPLTAIRNKRQKQLDAIQRYYVGLGWNAGPHLFIDDRWIWLFTPLNTVGIHAKEGNSYTVAGRLHYTIGIEVVGWYGKVVWPPAIQVMVRSAVQALQRRLKTFQIVYKPAIPHRPALHQGSVAFHRDYNKPECPGAKITPGWTINVLQDQTPVPPPVDPLRAAQLPGPNATIRYCSSPMAAFYAQHGAVGFFGYPLNDETAATGLDGRVCSYLTCERAVIKRVEPEGVHLALSSEARERKWF
jgi:hypothetical protein